MDLRQSTASQEVPLGYFVDSTDGNTEETGLTIANTDIKIWKTGATSLASKNSGGATHMANGVYYATLDATDTDTIGPLVIFVHVSGALAVRLECNVLDEAVYDVKYGTTAPSTFASGGNVNVTQISGDTTAADNAESFFDGTGYAGTNNVIPTTTTVTNGVTVSTNNDKTGYRLSATGIQDVWDALTSALTTASSIGKLLVDNINATISSRLASASYTAPDNTSITAIKAKTDNLPVDPADASDIAAAFATTDGLITTVDTVVDAIKAKTDSLTFTIANQVDANMQYINDTQLTGDGAGTPWGPV